MNSRKGWLLAAVVGAVVVSGSRCAAQQGSTPLTNGDVVKMVKAGLPEPAVVATIQANSGKYDTSPDALIALHQAGVTKAEMDALMAASAQPAPAARSSAGGNSSDAAMPADATEGNPAGATTARWKMPTVTVVQSNGPQELPMEKTSLAQTTAKPQSLAGLAGDSAVTQGLQVGVNTATGGIATHMNSGVGGSAVMQAGGIFGGVIAHRQPEVTYVWGVPGPASANVRKSSRRKSSGSRRLRTPAGWWPRRKAKKTRVRMRPPIGKFIRTSSKIVSPQICRKSQPATTELHRKSRFCRASTRWCCVPFRATTNSPAET
jgi:hypothetical protein